MPTTPSLAKIFFVVYSDLFVSEDSSIKDKFLILKPGRHCSVDSSAPTILPPWVTVPSTPSMLLSYIVKFVLYLSCEKNETKQQEAGFGPF